jgi:hypothetical protein
MKDPMEPDVAPTATADLQNRRRPGRRAYRNPHLIALLRRPLSPDPVDGPVDGEAAPIFDESVAQAEASGHRHELTAARGIAIAMAIGAAFWLFVFLAVRYWRLI